MPERRREALNDGVTLEDSVSRAVKVIVLNMITSAAALNGQALEFSLISAPPTVELISPAADSSTFMPHPHLRWRDVPDADRYEIQIAPEPEFLTLTDSDSIPVPRYVPLDPLPSGRDYWWRVRVRLRDGRTGPWASPGKITLAEPRNQYTVSVGDTVSTITNSIAAAAANTPARLTFEPGVYRLHLPDDTWLFQLASVENLIIDGNGSTVIIDNHNSGFSQFTACSNILLRWVEVDYRTEEGVPTTHTAGTVISTDSPTGSFVFEPLAGYLPPDDPIIRDATQRRWGCLMHPDIPGRLKTGVNNWFDFKPEVDSLGDNRFRLYLVEDHKARIGNFQEGDRFVKSATWGEYVMSAFQSKDITYEQVVSYAGGANHFIGNRNDGIHFLRCASRIKPGRWVSNGCGGYVGTWYRTGFWIEECFTEGLFDDSVACNNRPLKIRDVISESTFRIWYTTPASMLEVGDHLTIYNPSTASINATVQVTGFDRSSWNVTVDGSIGEVFPGNTETTNTFVYIDELTHPYAYVRNNTFQNSRRFGCGAFRSHGGVIEGNTFIGLSEAAISCDNDRDISGGGLNARNVRVLNNYIEDCGYSVLFYGQNRGVIEFGKNLLAGVSGTESIHDGIEISGNQIYDWNRTGISVEYARNVQIVSNTVSDLKSGSFYPGGRNDSLYVNRVDGIRIIGNDLRDARPVDESIRIENSADTEIRGNMVVR